MQAKTRYSVTLLIPVVAALAVFGCSLNYDEAFVAEDLSEEIPDTILHDFEHTSVRNGRPVYQLTAERAETYAGRNETILSGVEFREFGSDGSVVSEGRAANTVFHTTTENAELTGGIYVNSLTENAEMTTDTLIWNDSARILVAGEGDKVTIVKESGSRFEGIGFKAELSTKRFTFGGPVSGTWADEDEE